ncbi:MAG: exodeoxyribonuclease VII large subunit [Actinobacteria bacterium]|nr:exodeoxyribonuclease VII large subunit [Actinomycetota bacterium]
MAQVEQDSLFAAEHTYGVGELAAAVTRVVASAFPSEVWVRGEINGLRPTNASGHVYFSLCERNSRRGPTASFGVALFRQDRLRVERDLAAWPAFNLADGLEVRIRGRVQHRHGRVQVVMSAVDPVHTFGRLAVARELVLRTLAAEGLVEANRALALPALPLRVGLVTSEGSAACHDVLASLETSGFGFHVLVADARVQGTGAELSLLRALRAVARRSPDVVLLVRGGGARTDLVAFDSERVARAVAAMPVPVVTGIGHETDTSVADEVAHRACKTPTACAALLVEAVAAARARSEAAWSGVVRVSTETTAGADRALSRRARGLATRTGGALAGANGRLDGRAGQLVTLARSRTARGVGQVGAAARRLDPVRLDARLRRAGDRLDEAASTLWRTSARSTAGADAKLDAVAARVGAADPARALARGWSLTSTTDGHLVRSAADVVAGQRLVTTLAHGRVHSTVTDIAIADPGDEHR